MNKIIELYSIIKIKERIKELGVEITNNYDKDDEITAYEKGEPGADWLQKVKNGGVEIGRILYESKKPNPFQRIG